MVNTMFEFQASVFRKGVVCRLCMKCDKDSLNIFVPDAVRGMEVWEVIRDLLNIEVADGDGLPDTVCWECLRKLMEFSEFKDMCFNSATELKKNIMVGGLKIEEEEEEGNPCKASHKGELCIQDVSPERPVPGVVCVPIEMENLVDIKEEVDPSESVDEGNYSENNLGNDGSEERPVSDVASDPLEMGCMVDVKKEVNPIESLGGEEIYRWKDINVDEAGERPVPDVVCVPLDMGALVDVKEEYVSSDSQGEEVTYRGENFGQGESRERAVNNVVFNPLEMGNLVDGQSIKEMGAEINEFHDRVEYVCNGCGFKCCDVLELRLHTCGSNVNDRIFLGKSPENNYHEESSFTWTKVDGVLRPFKCESCGKSYAYKKDIIRHLLIHSGLKPFKCETCGKAFSRKSTLNRHLVLHSGLKPFKCETCLKEFSQKGNLVQHLPVHSGLKQFKCEMCGKSFGYRSNLLKHLSKPCGLTPSVKHVDLLETVL